VENEGKSKRLNLIRADNMVDKLIGNMTKKLVKEGEMKAPVKSIKVKVKFSNPKSRALKG
jgi:hypothetical protein